MSNIYFTFLFSLAIFLAAGTASAQREVFLPDLKTHFVAQDGDILTGKLDSLGQQYKISIAPGATVTLRNAFITGANDANDKWAGITCEGDATIILEG